jgi:hypothetical protein
MAIPTFEWRGEKPADSDEWERLVREDLHDPIGGLEVAIEQVPNGWRVLKAMSGGSAVGTPSPIGTLPVAPPRTDERERVTRVLREAGKPVVD